MSIICREKSCLFYDLGECALKRVSAPTYSGHPCVYYKNRNREQ